MSLLTLRLLFLAAMAFDLVILILCAVKLRMSQITSDLGTVLLRDGIVRILRLSDVLLWLIELVGIFLCGLRGKFFADDHGRTWPESSYEHHDASVCACCVGYCSDYRVSQCLRSVRCVCERPFEEPSCIFRQQSLWLPTWLFEQSTRRLWIAECPKRQHTSWRVQES